MILFCDLDKCVSPYYARGYCRAHYMKARRKGLLPPKPRVKREKRRAEPRKVATPTCHPERKHRALGLCVSCYFRQYRGTEDLPVNKAIYELEASEWLTVKEVAEMLNVEKEWLDTQLKARGFVHE